MREIKFDFVARNIHFDEIHHNVYTLDQIWDGREILTWLKSDNCETIARRLYTGLKDKNGVEIYEGDIFIVKSLHDGDEGVWNQDRHNSGGDGAIPQVVEWSEKRFGFEFGNSTRIKYEPYDFEVIGNIYENPDLLEQSDDQKV